MNVNFKEKLFLQFLQDELLTLCKYLNFAEFHHRIVDYCGKNTSDNEYEVYVREHGGGIICDYHSS